MPVKELKKMRIWGILVMLVCLIIDQATKWWILMDIMNPPSVIPMTSFFSIVLTWNRGVSFGMMNQLGVWGPHILTAVAALVSIGLSVWFVKARNWWLGIGLSMVIGGAIGNILDRIYHGAVVDFLYFYWGKFAWPAFNMADTFITLGVMCIICESFITQKKGE